MARPTTAMKTGSKPVTHASFTIDRTYPVSPSKVFHAFADKETKGRWFVDGEGFHISRYDADFREGGGDLYEFSFRGGPEIVNDTRYLDIVKDERIVFSYKLAVAGDAFSVSLVTVEFAATPKGATLMTYTEQGAYFDPEDPPRREAGTKTLLDQLGQVLGG